MENMSRGGERHMGLKISGLNELRERLERLRPEEVMARALAEQAERMAARVRDGLSEQPGTAGHDEPWLRSGALRDSVGAQADGLQAVIGSSDPAAVPQELGTAHMPARPFLAPVAAGMGEDVARAVGARVAAALRGDDTDANETIQQSRQSPDPARDAIRPVYPLETAIGIVATGLAGGVAAAARAAGGALLRQFLSEERIEGSQLMPPLISLQ